MQKDTCWAETTSNSEKIEPIPLHVAVMKLRLSEVIRQAGGQAGIISQ